MKRNTFKRLMAAFLSAVMVCGMVMPSFAANAVAEQEVADISLIAPQAADDLLGITGVAASFVVFRKGGAVHISARSMGAMNVQVIMERLGGGGHQTMAATQLQDTTVAEAKEQLFAAIRED